MNTDKIYAEQIANEYSKKETSKVKALKKLDSKVKNTANIFAFTFGIVSALVMGVGMCLSMSVIGSGGVASMVLGVVVGCLGMAGAGVNYPLYKKILQKSKDKYAADIIRLANEIVNED